MIAPDEPTFPSAAGPGAGSPAGTTCDIDNNTLLAGNVIANGILRESDRPNCVHWTSIRGEREPLSEDLAKILDADAMLHAAGVQTLVGQLAKASRQGPEALNALYREWYID